MIAILKSIYRVVKSCVRYCGDLSDFFDVSLGVKQGEPLSPLLFILFINDVQDNINVNNLSEYDINQLCIFLLLFTTNPRSLQLQLNSLYEFSQKWGLKINTKKTKICIFENRKSNCNFDWFIHDCKIDVVDAFCYLGVNLSRNEKMALAVKTFSEQAVSAVNQLHSLFSRIYFDVNTKLLLFDRLVVPILLYGSEVCGIYDMKEIDKVHIKFCKSILGVRPQTPNLAVFGELGRLPLSLLAKERSFKYLLKIFKNPTSIMYAIFIEQYNDVLQTGKNELWTSAIKKNLESLGFAYVW